MGDLVSQQVDAALIIQGWKMSWSKGFLRLWAVLTAAWMAIAISTLGADHFKGLWRPNVVFEVTYKGGTEDVLDSVRSRSDLRQQIIDGVKRDSAKLQRADPVEAKKQMDEVNQSADELLKELDKENSSRAERLRTGLAIVLAPPLVLLIIGLALAWVLKGFRPSNA